MFPGHLFSRLVYILGVPLRGQAIAPIFYCTAPACRQTGYVKGFPFYPSRGLDSKFRLCRYIGRLTRQGCCDLSELLCLSRRANKERVATARPGAQIFQLKLTIYLRCSVVAESPIFAACQHLNILLSSAAALPVFLRPSMPLPIILAQPSPSSKKQASSSQRYACRVGEGVM